MRTQKERALRLENRLDNVNVLINLKNGKVTPNERKILKAINGYGYD